MAGKSKVDTAAVYRTIADMLPVEVRDYRLHLSTAVSDGSETILVEGVTAMGMAWVPFLRDKLEALLKQSGVGVEIVGQKEVKHNEASADEARADQITVKTLRKKAADATAAEVAKRIEALKADVKAKEDALAKLQKELKDVGGRDDELRKAFNEKRAADRALQHAKLVDAKVAQIRATVEQRAVKRAETEKQAGNDWSVDQDAPITTLFDRMDVENRMGDKEQGILRMAELAAQMDEIGERAVSSASKYALTKKKGES